MFCVRLTPFKKNCEPSLHSFRGIVSVCLTCCHKICEPSSHSFHGICERSPNSFRRIVSVRLICFLQNLWAFVALLHIEFVSVRFTVNFHSFSRNLWVYIWLLFTELKCFHTADICLNHNMILLCMGGGGQEGAEIKFYHWRAIRFWSEQVHLDWRIMIYDKVLLILLSWWCKHYNFKRNWNGVLKKVPILKLLLLHYIF